MALPPQPLSEGLHKLWATPVKLVNLLDGGLVAPALHAWLCRHADDPQLVPGPASSYLDPTKSYSRNDLSVFAAPRFAELEEIAALLVEQADVYARETLLDPLPVHEKMVNLWFHIQRPNALEDTPSAHYHEAGDVALVYYLTVASNGSGAFVMHDPRGCVGRGGRAFPRPNTALRYAPRPGDLLLFPRYVAHYAILNTDAHVRKLIAGFVAYDMPRAKALAFAAKTTSSATA